LERRFDGQPENQTALVLRSETVEAVNDERRRVEQKVEKLIVELRRRSAQSRNEQDALKQKAQTASAAVLQAEVRSESGKSLSCLGSGDVCGRLHISVFCKYLDK
jgi:hypothetical protein